MLIVAGRIHIEADGRDGYVEGCAEVVAQARLAPGCLDFALSADIADPTRVNVYERWGSRDALTAFRGSGDQPDGLPAIETADVLEFEVAGEPTRP